MAVQYDQPHMVLNNPTKFRQIRGFRGVSSTSFGQTHTRTGAFLQSPRRERRGTKVKARYLTAIFLNKIKITGQSREWIFLNEDCRQTKHLHVHCSPSYLGFLYIIIPNIMILMQVYVPSCACTFTPCKLPVIFFLKYSSKNNFMPFIP